MYVKRLNLIEYNTRPSKGTGPIHFIQAYTEDLSVAAPSWASWVTSVQTSAAAVRIVW